MLNGSEPWYDSVALILKTLVEAQNYIINNILKTVSLLLFDLKIEIFFKFKQSKNPVN